MRARLLILALAASLVGAPGAHAADQPPLPIPPTLPIRALVEHGKFVRPAPIFRSGFVAETSDGYKVGVNTFGSAVLLEVWRGRKEQRTLTAYMARGVATPQRLQATFGRFGKVSMRFRQSRNRTWSGKHRNCRGAQRFVKRRGLFVGKLTFEGEDHYLSVDLHRAKGAVVTEAEKCRNRRPGFELPDFGFLFFEPQAALLATARDGVDVTALLAVEGRKKTSFLATREESRGKLAIVRVAALRRPSPIHFNEALTAGSLSPAAPFHGTGRYRAAPDGTTTWSGNLSVNFPGAPRFPLTGPGFEETLVFSPF